jgi:hypothetical protein
MYLRRYIGKSIAAEKPHARKYEGLKFLLPPTIPLLFYPLTFVGLSETRCFLIGVSVSLLVLYFLLKIDGKLYWLVLKKSFTWNLVLAIFGIMILRQMIELSQAHVLIAEMMQSYAFPALAIVILIPFLLGMLTGYNLGAVALSFPLVEPFFVFTGVHIVGLTSLVFMSSLLGYLISPIHLCNVLSCEYLKTDITRMYKMYLPAIAVVFVVQVLFVLLVFPS